MMVSQMTRHAAAAAARAGDDDDAAEAGRKQSHHEDAFADSESLLCTRELQPYEYSSYSQS